MFSTGPNLEDEEYEMSSRIDGIGEDVVSSRINFGDLGGFAGQVICCKCCILIHKHSLTESLHVIRLGTISVYLMFRF